MQYRKIAASQIFDGQRFLPPGQVLILDANGQVVDLVPADQAGENLERYDGILCPGFVNAHCHLELSHLKGLVPAGTGLVEFLVQVVTKRGSVQVDVQEAIHTAEQEMAAAGIVAVGDICNTTDSLPVKQRSGIAWTNFIEVLSFRDETAAERVAHYQAVRDQFRTLHQAPYRGQAQARASLVPHAPYSISPRSFQLINEASTGELISMHNQETPAEDELFRSGQGDFLRLYSLFGSQQAPQAATGLSSLQSTLPYFNRQQSLLLIHNTCTTPGDLDFARDYADAQGLDLHFCFCPNANLYIENKLPDVQAFRKQGVNIVLGTDSLSSNYQLSIAEEVRTLNHHFPDLGLETLLGWATWNGARALRRDDELGSFEAGKRPGVVLLDAALRPKRLA